MAGRLRLNVSAIFGNEGVELGKFLVVVDEESRLEVLKQKVEKSLRRGGLPCGCELLNCSKAQLPDDEAVGDMLRDGEDIFARLPVSTVPPRNFSHKSAESQALARNVPCFSQDAPKAAGSVTMVERVSEANTSVAHMMMPSGSGYIPVQASVTLPAGFGQPPPDHVAEAFAQRRAEQAQRQLQQPVDNASSSEDEIHRPAKHGTSFPRPMESFVADMEHLPTESVQVDHPCETIKVNTYDADWLVENMTPKLRAFIFERFQADLVTEPKYVAAIGKFVSSRYLQLSGAFVSVFMRPQTVVGSAPGKTLPVHYNIPRADITAFCRKAELDIDTAQKHMDKFGSALFALRGLLSKGRPISEHVNVMLPLTYEAFDEVEGLMMEVDRPLVPLGQSDGSHPVIIVDTNGLSEKQQSYVKASLKRALHAHLNMKTSFQLIRFVPATGEPRLWAKAMMSPTDQAVSAAEEWIDGLVPVRSSQLLTAVHYAFLHKDCDEVWIISTGECEPTMHDKILREVRQVNKREVPVHCVGIETSVPGELMLRSIAESNHGDFYSKPLISNSGTMDLLSAVSNRDSKWTSWRTQLVNEKSQDLCDSFKKPRMSIGSQIRILEVMNREEYQKKDLWIQEWQCAQRLLATQEEERMKEMTRDSVKEMERKSMRTIAARTGGGFLYATGGQQLGLEGLFEHKLASPWTDHSETAASGPRVPHWDANAGRLPRLPLDPDPFPTMPAATGLPNRIPSSPKASRWTLRGDAAHNKSTERTASADRAAGFNTPPPSRYAVTSKKKGTSHKATSSARKASHGQSEAWTAAPNLEATTPGLPRRWSF